VTVGCLGLEWIQLPVIDLDDQLWHPNFPIHHNTSGSVSGDVYQRNTMVVTVAAGPTKGELFLAVGDDSCSQHTTAGDKYCRY
jgi:hypothetical protein